MFLKKILSLTLSSTLLFSCSSVINENKNNDSKEPIVGGSCEYNKIKGKITITSIKSSNESDQNCSNDSVVVEYKFIPSNPEDVKNYKFPSYSDTQKFLVGGSSKNPDKKWIEKFNVKVGNTYDATRDEITKGTCTPYMIVVPELEKTALDFCN